MVYYSRTIFILLIACLSLAGFAHAAEAAPHPSSTTTTTTLSTTSTLAGLLQPVRDQYKLPCLGAAVIVHGRLAAVGVVGVRKLDSSVQACDGDLFHLGSCTKAMTATVLARLIDEGTLDWNQTLAATFPEWKDAIHPRYRGVTVEQLLCHRAGLPDNPSFGWRLKGATANESESPGLRLAIARQVLAAKPASAPGKEFVYSNTGYIILAAMAEKVTGKAFEDLMREKLFKPLGMATAGFGPAGDPQKIDQPWPHKSLLSKVYPVDPGSFGSDNPPFYAPAGTVHCSLTDWARFAGLHLGHAPAHDTLLSSKTLARLHSLPFGGDYGYGWGVVERTWAGGPALTHVGSNTMNCAVIWLAPKKDFAVLVATNQMTDKTFDACDQAASAIIKRYLND